MGEKIKPRVLRFEPQVTFDELYRSPLRRERRYETTGDGTTEPQVKTVYVELEQPVVRMMDELLRYTDLTPAEVARRSGIGSVNNLYLVTKRNYKESPVEHRRKIRLKGDEGRYKL